MAGLMIHLAVANVVYDNNKELIKDKKDFIDGVNAPDILKVKYAFEGYADPREESHKMNLCKNFETLSGFELGYFVHIITDHYFYKIFPFNENFYHDYDSTNKYFMEKYNIKIPKASLKGIPFKDEELIVLNIDELDKFIQSFANISIKDEYSKFKYSDLNNKMLDEEDCFDEIITSRKKLPIY